MSTTAAIINKIRNTIAAHPKITMAFAGIAITFAIGAAIGMISPEQVFATRGGNCGTC